MGLSKPVFQDGTYIKTNDLTRLLEYTVTLIKALGSVFKDGILTGLHFEAAGTTIILQAGTAIADDGSLITVDAGDALSFTLTRTAFFAAANAGLDIYLVKSSEDVDATRPNLIGQQNSVATSDVYTLVFSSLPDSLTTPKVKLGRLPATISVTTTVSEIDYNYALEQLTHSQFDNITGKYSGPILNAETALADQTVTHTKLKKNGNYLDSTLSWLDGAIDWDVIREAAIKTKHLEDGIITTVKLGDAQVTDAKLASDIDGAKIATGTIPRTGLAFEVGIETETKISSYLAIPYASSTNVFGVLGCNLRDEATNGYKPAQSWSGEKVYGPTDPSQRTFSSFADIQALHNSFVSAYLTTSPPTSGGPSLCFSSDGLRKTNYLANTIFTALPPTVTNTGAFLSSSSDARDSGGGPTVSAFWWVIGMDSDMPGLAAARWFPRYLKLSNFTTAIRKMPDALTLSGELPILSLPYLTAVNTDDLLFQTPWIIPPDGYYIERISGSLRYNGEYFTLMFTPGTNDDYYDGRVIMPRAPFMLIDAATTSSGTINGIQAKLAFKSRLATRSTGYTRSTFLDRDIVPHSAYITLKIRRVSRSVLVNADDAWRGAQPTSEYFIDSSQASPRETQATIFVKPLDKEGTSATLYGPTLWTNTPTNSSVNDGYYIER